MVGQDVIAHQVVIAIQHSLISTVSVTGHINEPHPWVFTFEMAYHIQVSLDYTGV